MRIRVVKSWLGGLAAIMLLSAAWSGWNVLWAHAGAGAFAEQWSHIGGVIDEDAWREQHLPLPEPTVANIGRELDGYVMNRIDRLAVAWVVFPVCVAVVLLALIACPWGLRTAGESAA